MPSCAGSSTPSSLLLVVVGVAIAAVETGWVKNQLRRFDRQPGEQLPHRDARHRAPRRIALSRPDARRRHGSREMASTIVSIDEVSAQLQSIRELFEPGIDHPPHPPDEAARRRGTAAGRPLEPRRARQARAPRSPAIGPRASAAHPRHPGRRRRRRAARSARVRARCTCRRDMPR